MKAKSRDWEVLILETDIKGFVGCVEAGGEDLPVGYKDTPYRCFVTLESFFGLLSCVVNIVA